MAALNDRALSELLAEVASPTPAPGGGCSAAWTCAFAAGLVEMTASIADAPEIARRARTLRIRAAELAELELHAYEPVLEAVRLPPGDPHRPARLQRALSEAAESPLDLARAAAETTALAGEAASRASAAVRGDALAGLLLAEAACQAAARLARINLADRPGDPRLAELDELTANSARARERERERERDGGQLR